MRLFKTVYGEVITTLSEVMPKQDVEKIVRAMDKVEKQDVEKIVRAMDKVDQVCSDTEDRMFLEHPDLSNEYIDVFYGDVRNDTRTDVDRKVVKMAHEMTEQLFEGGGRK